MNNIITLRHPEYLTKSVDWKKFRLVMGRSADFVNTYLVKYSSREGNSEFTARKSITPNPAYARASLIETRNNIYRCMADITRIGGTNSYQEAITGSKGGVDRQNSNMNSFVGVEILTELLSMGKVGVYVDRSRTPITTKADQVNNSPYMYVYKAENILSWTYSDQGELISLLLRDLDNVIDPMTGLTINGQTAYRHLMMTDPGVAINYYDAHGTLDNERSTILNLPAIPFAIGELSSSLLDLTADYQIALLNIESSDIAYTLTANFPFYTEQFTPQARHFGGDDGEGNEEEDDKTTSRDRQVGSSQGRLYGRGLDRPGFIHPSPEPLRVSMEKQAAIKQAIRHLMQLTVASLTPMRESAESKDKDRSSLQDGLAYIGLELQKLETTLSNIWASYDRKPGAQIKYPEDYDFRSVEERLDEAQKYGENIDLPSLTYQKEVAKCIAQSVIGNKISTEKMATVLKEIDASKGVSIDSDDLRSDVEIGLVDRETAANIRQYPEEAVKKATEEHIERLAAVAIAQSKAAVAPAEGVRGVVEGAADDDKEDVTAPTGKKPVRGEGKTSGEE